MSKKIISICIILACAMGCTACSPTADRESPTQSPTQSATGFAENTTAGPLPSDVSEYSVAPQPGVPPESFTADENTANAAARVTGVAARPTTSVTGTNANPSASAAQPPMAPPAPTQAAPWAIRKGEVDRTAKTATWLRPLPSREIAIADPDNSKGLPTKKVEHSFGVPENGSVHNISRESQSFFDQKGYAAVTYDNKSTAKVLYLTFDCGYENGNTARILDVLREKKVPAAFFCTVDEMRSAPEIIARMINEGHIVGNHSVTHPHFSAISRTQMAKEVLEADNYLRQNFGYSAPFFRFPYGEYNESALEAVASLGFISVFWSSSYKDWDTDDQKGGQYAYDTVTSRLHPGAIILLHSVSSDNAQAMGRIIDKARADGYTFRNLTALPAFRS